MSLSVLNVRLLFHYVLDNCESIFAESMEMHREIPCSELRR